MLLAGAAVAGEEPAATSPVVRRLEERDLDRYVLLRADVKVAAEEVRRVVAGTFPAPNASERVQPITVVTESGVFYASDYDRRELQPRDVRPGIRVGPVGHPTLAIDPAQGATVGEVVELTRDVRVAFRAGDLVRVTGFEGTPAGIRITLEGLGAGPASVLVRGAEPAADAEGEAERVHGWLGALWYDLPDDAAARAGWIESSWPSGAQEAIRAGRVAAGMSRLQVLLAWGNPLLVSRDGEVEIWLYKRGASLRDQLRSRSNVFFAGGAVVQVEGGEGP